MPVNFLRNVTLANGTVIVVNSTYYDLQNASATVPPRQTSCAALEAYCCIDVMDVPPALRPHVVIPTFAPVSSKDQDTALTIALAIGAAILVIGVMWRVALFLW
jgi:hypothetical protein